MIGNDGMTLLYVPAGEFKMGSDADDALAECQKFVSDCKRESFANEEPPHTVALDAFWIDQTEVTNAMYAKCVDAGVCVEPASSTSYTRDSYYGNPEFDNYPVIYVSVDNARVYCKWANRRLPTEAEWEKAARGENCFVYPWGNDFDGTRANFCDKSCSFDSANKSFDDGYADTAPVGSYLNGASPYGALDMAGNVLEWVSSLYKPYPYDATDGRKNFGSSGVRLVRGGDWASPGYYLRSALRVISSRFYSSDIIGFRCARST
jgi:formylglycine-generating enzyme required for sulfatase activity